VSAFGARARFLFREEQGVIDAQTWRRHVAWLVLVVLGMTALWMFLSPYAHHDLATSAFIAPMTILAFAYLLVFAFAVIIAAISYTMLSAKRLRDRKEPTGLAGLVPLLALCAGSLHFLQGKTPDVISHWYVLALDGVLCVVAVLTIVDLGFRPGRA
jgi:ABC-type uncharacterized transport system permease subunit